jgi:hypothetical protein
LTPQPHEPPGHERRNQERNIKYERHGKKLRIRMGVPQNTPGHIKQNQNEMRQHMRDEHQTDPLDEVEFTDDALNDQLTLLRMALDAKELGIPTRLTVRKKDFENIEFILDKPLRDQFDIITKGGGSG